MLRRRVGRVVGPGNRDTLSDTARKPAAALRPEVTLIERMTAL